MKQPKPGTLFTHQRYLTSDRQPVKMRVTSVRRGCVYFTHAEAKTNKGAWYLPIDAWNKSYGETLTEIS